jgi:hypothetical protein
MVLGVFRTALAIPISIEASLPSPAIRLNTTIRNYARRAHLLASNHPLAKAIHRAQTKDSRLIRNQSQHLQLLSIANSIPENDERDTEQIIPYRFRPWDTPTYKTTISLKSKTEEAIEHNSHLATKRDNCTTIYSDASQIKDGNGIGVGLVAYNSTLQEIYLEKTNIGDY